LKLLIDLGSDYLEFWTYLEPIFTADGISLFCKTLPFGHVSEDIWKKILVRLEEKPNEEVRTRRYFVDKPSKSVDSTILSSFPPIFKEFEGKTFRLLYRGTRGGFRASNFHTKCDGQSNTMTIILTTQGYIFGGFSPIAWDSSSNYKPDDTRKSFVFSLKNPRNSEPKIFSISDPRFSIRCNASDGPVFGGGCDIYIADNCDQNVKSRTGFGHSYTNDTGINGTQVLAGQTNFQVKEIEVFSIDCETNTNISLFVISIEQASDFVTF
jgi:hypothetical protein